MSARRPLADLFVARSLKSSGATPQSVPRTVEEMTVTSEMSFQERCSVKLGIAAVHAGKSFLDARSAPPPTDEQMLEIARELSATVAAMVREVGPTLDSGDDEFTALVMRACSIGASVTARVVGLSVNMPTLN